MKRVIVSLIFAVFITLVPAANAQNWQKRVSIANGRERTIPGFGIKIKFLAVVEDSRCPVDVNCIWAGNAKIKIVVRSGRGRLKTFELNSATAPTVVSYAGYDFKLVNLTPQLRSNIRINPNKYIATIEMKKSGR